jgi:hypothetical protein
MSSAWVGGFQPYATSLLTSHLVSETLPKSWDSSLPERSLGILGIRDYLIPYEVETYDWRDIRFVVEVTA